MKEIGSLNIPISEEWYGILSNYFKSNYCGILMNNLEKETIRNVVYPDTSLIFNAYNSCPLNKVKVIIIGQDPYHGQGQAQGLSFSVPEGVTIPPSLHNIFKEIYDDEELPKSGDLSYLADQGVLLLNSILTVRENMPLSHQNIGWEVLTDYTIVQLSKLRTGLVFLLWGKKAQKKELLIDKSKHYVLKAAHPSPFSAYHGFFGCNHFNQTNLILKEIGEELINWKS